MISFICPACGSRAQPDTYQYRCKCGSPWEIDFEAKISKDNIHYDIYSIWRYKKAIPLPDHMEPVSLGEGWTPLLSSDLHGEPILIKPEWINPTGSFKDRGASVVVSFLKYLGIHEAMDDSSGNAGASLAAYCAHSGITCHIFSPAHASGGKISQIKWYGAKLNLIKGTRKDVFKALEQKVASIYYASHNMNPFFFEGTKTLAYEICEQSGWAPPNHIVVPLGYGGLYFGLMKGFIECYKSGIVRNIPRVHGIQSELYSPLYYAFRNNLNNAPEWNQNQRTLAEGIAAAQPFYSEKILKLIRQYHGHIEVVNEKEIISGLKILARKGFYVEPTSAVVVEGYQKLRQNKVIKPGDSVLLILTGSGLKAYHELDSLLVQK